MLFRSILIDLGAAELLGKYTGGFMKKLFHISPAGVTSLLMGLISGYPLGAKVCCELYQNKSITKTDAERLLAFCNNAGPVFITGTVGTAMLGSFKWGLLLMMKFSVCDAGNGLGCVLNGFPAFFAGRRCSPLASV